MKRYREWTIRQGSTAQCSPALMVVGCIVVLAAVFYVYREVILTTLLDAVLAAVGIALLVGAGAVVVNTLRWYRRQQAAAALDAEQLAMDYEARDTWTKTVDTAEAAAISGEADRLAEAGTELVFTPDGSLAVRNSK